MAIAIKFYPQPLYSITCLLLDVYVLENRHRIGIKQSWEGGFVIRFSKSTLDELFALDGSPMSLANRVGVTAS